MVLDLAAVIEIKHELLRDIRLRDLFNRMGIELTTSLRGLAA